jgi:hypothetical protein
MSRIALATASLAIIAVVAGCTIASPAHASWTGCRMRASFALLNRPDGYTMGRWHAPEGGKEVAIREVYRGWAFVSHWVDPNTDNVHEEYGWVPRNHLTNCRPMEGTP